MVTCHDKLPRIAPLGRKCTCHCKYKRIMQSTYRGILQTLAGATAASLPRVHKQYPSDEQCMDQLAMIEHV